MESVLLTGGASSRMGTDKASLLIGGELLAERIARELATRSHPVTVLGRTAINGYAFVPDRGEFEGPLVALSRFQPVEELVFVASCDLLQFRASVIDELEAKLGDAEAVLPFVNQRQQPLCALYRRQALAKCAAMVASGERRVMSWVWSLNIIEARSPSLDRLCANVNTPAELKEQSDFG